MKKLILILAIALCASQALAVLDVNLVKVGSTIEVRYTGAGTTAATRPRAFALDLTLNGTTGTFTSFVGGSYKTGESTSSSRGYGIYPATIDINTAGGVVSYGSPLADPCDAGANGTGFGKKHIILEFGSLYVGEANAPATSGTLCALNFSQGNATTATMVGENLFRATNAVTNTGVVFEDGSMAVVNASLPLASAPAKATLVAPTPNGAINVCTNTDLSWSAGSGATSHNVYFGTANPPQSRGNQTATTYDTAAMANNTTYYWQIDEAGPGGTTTGDLWSFTTIAVAGQAVIGAPAPSGTTCVSVTQDLSWSAGVGATSHDVYFGTAASPPQVSTGQTTLTYDTLTMANNTTYYWKINEKNACGDITTGTIWSFSTIQVAPGKATTPISPSNNAVGQVRTGITLSWTAAGGTSRNVYFGTATTPPQVTTGQTTTTYATGTMGQGKQYYWRVDEKNACGTVTTGDLWNFRVEECVKSTAAYYTPWKGGGTMPWNRPDCWCYKRNCRGDADGLKQLSLYWVYTNDLTVFRGAYGKTDAQMTGNKICADFMRDKQLNLYRVYTNDLTPFRLAYGKSEAQVKCCDADQNCTLVAGDVISFWTN